MNMVERKDVEKVVRWCVIPGFEQRLALSCEGRVREKDTFLGFSVSISV